MDGYDGGDSIEGDAGGGDPGACLEETGKDPAFAEDKQERDHTHKRRKGHRNDCKERNQTTEGKVQLGHAERERTSHQAAEHDGKHRDVDRVHSRLEVP